MLPESYGDGLGRDGPRGEKDPQGGVSRRRFGLSCGSEADRPFFLSRRGQLKIAEVTSRFTNVDAFVALIEFIGFKKTHKVRPCPFSFAAGSLTTPPTEEHDQHAFHHV